MEREDRPEWYFPRATVLFTTLAVGFVMLIVAAIGLIAFVVWLLTRSVPPGTD